MVGTAFRHIEFILNLHAAHHQNYPQVSGPYLCKEGTSVALRASYGIRYLQFGFDFLDGTPFSTKDTLDKIVYFRHSGVKWLRMEGLNA